MKKIKIEIPDYLTLEQFVKLSKIDHLTDLEKMIFIISVISTYSVEEIRTWDVNNISKISGDLVKLMETQHEFHPIIEWDGVEYGFAALKYMKLGEYIDLENQCKDTNSNIARIMSILYRPIKKNKLNGVKFQIKHGIKLRKNDVENIFNYYTLEDYDSEITTDRVDKFKNFPLPFAMGALVFFLVVATSYLNNIAYSQTPKMGAKMEKMIMEQALVPIGDGLARFIHSQKPISLKSEEKIAC